MTVSQRLNRRRLRALSVVLAGAVGGSPLRPITRHADARRFAGAASIQHIQCAVRGFPRRIAPTRAPGLTTLTARFALERATCLSHTHASRTDRTASRVRPMKLRASGARGCTWPAGGRAGRPRGRPRQPPAGTLPNARVVRARPPAFAAGASAAPTESPTQALRGTRARPAVRSY